MTDFTYDHQLAPASSAASNRVLVVEDEPLYGDQLELLLRKLGYEPAGPVATAQAALALYQAEPIELVLLDIGLRGPLDGIQLAEMLLAHSPVPLIFLTSFVDEVTFRRAQAVGPAAYLLKPIDDAALKRAMALAVSNFSRTSWPTAPLPPAPAGPGVIYVKDNGLLEKVSMQDILCLQADNRTCTIVLAERSLTVHMPLRELARALPSSQFVQIQRSYFINLAHLERVDPTRYLVQLGKQLLPVGRLYLPGLLNRLSTFA